MRALCLGGGLQGIEAVYLGKKAGWTMAVVDKNPRAPAIGLADWSITANLMDLNIKNTIHLAAGFDLLIPTLEDEKIIERFTSLAQEQIIPPVTIDFKAYKITSSKKKSKKIFKSLSLPMPASFSDTESFGQYIIKPDNLSGSRGLKILDAQDVRRLYPTEKSRQGLVIEEYLSGPQYSVEVTARNGQAKSFQVTLLNFESAHDCYQVIAPSGLSPEREDKFGRMAELIAKKLSLTGIMDLEAIDSQGVLKLLEIDARFPSQTPTAIYYSTGVNLLVEMVNCFIPVSSHNAVTTKAPKNVIFEHVHFQEGQRRPPGEWVMTTMGPLSVVPGFMGAQEALVGGKPETGNYVATLIRLFN
ncbi:MAG: 3-methylornithine--L-lysine ligase PylC [Deltaproteobacteria bacterium]|jgi:pyrrolysine biosynthesis protein PylC|nr:3-methylornithine--L-lysine ligase PylC [Deltaproteobacteria bacterium]